MPAFSYVVMDRNNKEKKGFIEAESAKIARQKLREQGFTPIEVQTLAGDNAKNTGNQLKSISGIQRTKIKVKDFALMVRQLSTLLSAGLPLEEAIAAVAEQSEKNNIKQLLLAVRAKVLEGYSLASALGSFPRSFPPLFCTTVAAGEKSGHLDLVLDRLADHTEQQWHTKQKIQQATIYPSLMIIVAIGIVGFLVEYVVPKMISVYQNMNHALPGITKMLIGVSNGLKSYGLYGIALLIVLFIIFRYSLRSENFRFKYHQLLLRIPFIGYAIKTTNNARFSRTFAILLAAGVPAIEAMTLSSQLITSLPIRKAVLEATNHVREGANIHLALKNTGYFPIMSIYLIASGEATGQLENMLNRAASNQESDVNRLIETSLALFEPMIILIMGAVVLFIVLAVLLPIFSLDQLAGG